jgi:predicted phosphoribosyltransferase
MHLGIGQIVKSRGKHKVRLGTIVSATLMLRFVLDASSSETIVAIPVTMENSVGRFQQPADSIICLHKRLYSS